MKRNLFIVASLVLLTGTGCGTLPDPPVTTVWQNLGIPQALIGIRDNLVNRRGNFPGLERVPPLKTIADPSNLESPFKMIEVGAEVKIAEDLAPQKIKALKYLGGIGCGCYDKDGAIEAAMMAGLEDCTADVRIAAAEAIQTAVGECACVDNCAQTCCTKAIQDKLAQMAYGEENGCYVEPNAEVRAAALAALSACPPIEEPIDIIGEDPMIIPEGSGNAQGEGSTTVPGTNDPNRNDDDDDDEDQAFNSLNNEQVRMALSDGAPVNATIPVISNDIPVISNGRTYYPEQQPPVVVTEDPELLHAIDTLVPPVHIEPEFNVEASADDTSAALIPAMIESLDPINGNLQIAFFDSYEIPVGTNMVLINNGREIDVVVTDSAVGRATTGITRGESGDRTAFDAGDVVNIGILAD